METGFKEAAATSAFINADGDTVNEASDQAAKTACSAVGISDNVCIKAKAIFQKVWSNLGKSGATTGDADLDKALCGTKPGPLASGSKWKTYHDCLMNKGASLKTNYTNALRAASPAQGTSPASLAADPSDISGTWLDDSGHAIHIDGAKIMDHPEGSFDTTFKPGTMSFTVLSREGWGTAKISADGKTLTWPSGNWVKAANSANYKGNSGGGVGNTPSATWGVKQWGLYVGIPTAAISAIAYAIYRVRAAKKQA